MIFPRIKEKSINPEVSTSLRLFIVNKVKISSVTSKFDLEWPEMVILSLYLLVISEFLGKLQNYLSQSWIKANLRKVYINDETSNNNSNRSKKVFATIEVVFYK